MSERLPRGVMLCATALIAAYVAVVVVCLGVLIGWFSLWTILPTCAIFKIIDLLCAAESREYVKSKEETG